MAALENDSEFQGVVLVGDTGTGKSALAHTLAEAVERRKNTVRFVLGTETSKAVPLGAFYWLMTLDAVREPAVMLAAAQRTLEQEKDLIVVVDDAHLLDPLSATLVYHLAALGDTRLIVTICSGNPVPDAVTALWKERVLLRLHLEGLTWQQTEELARAVLDDAVDARLVDELHRQTAGNPLMLRSLLSEAREAGVLVRSKHGWQLRGALHADRDLSDLLEVRLQSLAAEELEAIEVLAAAEALSWETLRGICDADAVARLERGGMIHAVDDESHTVVRLANPLLGEVALKRGGLVRARQLNGMLAQHLRKKMQDKEQQSRSPDVRTRIRVAQYMMRSDLAPDLDLIVEAAASAVAMSNVALGEELARFAFDHGGGLPAAIVLGETLRWQGRADEAEAVLADAAPSDDAAGWLTVQWGCLRAANLFFGCGQVEQARLLLGRMKDRVDTREMTDLVTAMEAAFACFSGDIPTAIELGLPLCASDQQPLTMTWAVISTAWALALAGRVDEVHRIANAGGAEVLGQMGPHRFVIAMAEVMAATVAGDFPAADRVWERYGPTATLGPEAGAFVHAILGFVHLGRGALPSACAAFRDSLSAMPQGFRIGVMAVAAWDAQAEGARGDSAAAAAALRTAEEAYGPQVAVFLPKLELARAWARASVGETTAARTHAMRAAQVAQRSGMYAIEMRALHTAVRFGDRSCAARLEELATMLNTRLAKVIATHARALSRHDGDLLDLAAAGFADLGAKALAADAAAQAADEHTRKGDHGKQVASSTRAYGLASQCGLHTPAVEVAAHPVPLTDREHEIAMLVVAGLSNHQIAERLVVSTRTVEGHLYRIFAKLGINNRNQLIHLMSLERSGR
ncbi:LuxR family transcriptional regulator [Mycobacterium branderi]|uniref:LuxR family transcriptional regulator n=1 Tax=Mycobacterium branderi TaxID=43348 RepID=A0ABM7KPB4_9MYCO|nr:LuxR family transcriptional regulator [Mycobacterium branderi]